MSDNPTADQQDEAPEPQEAVQEAEHPQEPEPSNREAARYRKRLRDTETERDNLTAQLHTARRALIDSLAMTAGRIRPEALWASGVDLADLLDEDGQVDVEKVTAACDEAAGQLGLTRRPKPDPAQGRASDAPAGDQFAEAFK